MSRYLLNIAIAIDQLANTVFGGKPHETISQRAAKARDTGQRWGCLLCGVLDRIQPNHCTNSLEGK